MKKLAITLSLVLALAIAAAVSLPVLAAPETLGTTTVTVTIEDNVIEVVLPPGSENLDMGPATPQDPGTTTPIDIIVGSNADAWDLVVSDQRTPASPVPVKGYMDNGTTTKLTNATEVQGGAVTAWAALTSDQTLHAATAPGSATVQDVEFQQRVEYTDPAGTYSITVTFLGITY